MPSSQEIAKLVETYIDGEEWQELNDVISISLGAAFPKMSIEIVTDLTEEHSKYVETILRDYSAITLLDGGILTYELDVNDRYIRRINNSHKIVLEKLRQVDPFYFEEICKKILDKLDAKAENTKKTNDGGVDFYAFDMGKYAADYPLPKTASLVLIGQAKRYKENNDVSESEVRKFIGGALKVVDEFRKNRKINVLSPIVYAFWTTSSFHNNAKLFCRDMGIWYMDGMTLAEYVIKLNLADEIFN